MTALRRPSSLVAVLAVAALGLTACGSSTPSNRRIATDVIDGLADDLPQDERQCMLDYIDGLPTETIDSLVELAESVRVVDGNLVDPPEQLVDFQNELAACRGVAPATTPGTSTAGTSVADDTAPVSSSPDTTTVDTTAVDTTTPATTDA